VVFQELAKGNAVSCLVRNKARLVVPPGSGGAKVGLPLTGARVTEGDVTNQADVDTVMPAKATCTHAFRHHSS
jgi:hypothetical protein